MRVDPRVLLAPSDLTCLVPILSLVSDLIGSSPITNSFNSKRLRRRVRFDNRQGEMVWESDGESSVEGEGSFSRRRVGDVGMDASHGSDSEEYASSDEEDSCSSNAGESSGRKVDYWNIARNVLS